MTPSGRRPPSTRRKTKRLAKKRRKNRLSTSRGPTDRRSLKSTSPTLTRIPDVEVVEDVDVVAAVDVVERVESTANAVRDQKANSVNAAKDQKANALNAVRDRKAIAPNVPNVHQGKREMLLPVVEVIAEAVAAVEVTAVAEEGEVAASRNLTWTRRLSQPWDRSVEIEKAKCDPGVHENMPGILYSLLTFRAFL